MNSKLGYLKLYLSNDLLIAFKLACEHNHINPNQLLKNFCEEYVETYGIHDSEDRLKTELSGGVNTNSSKA